MSRKGLLPKEGMMYWLVCKGERLCCVDGFPAGALNKFVREYPQFEVIAL